VIDDARISFPSFRWVLQVCESRHLFQGNECAQCLPAARYFRWRESCICIKRPISRVAFIAFRVPRAKDDEFRVSTRSIASASIVRTLNPRLVPRSAHRMSGVPDVRNCSRIIGKCHLRTRNPDTRTGIAARCARHLDRAHTISPGSRGHAEGRREGESGGTRRDPSGTPEFFLLINAYQWRAHAAAVIADGQVFIKPRSARRIYTPGGITNTTVDYVDAPVATMLRPGCTWDTRRGRGWDKQREIHV